MKRLSNRAKRIVKRARRKIRTKTFAEQAHRDSLAIANSPTEAEDQAFLNSVSWWNSEEAVELAKREPDVPWWRTEDEKK